MNSNLEIKEELTLRLECEDQNNLDLVLVKGTNFNRVGIDVVVDRQRGTEPKLKTYISVHTMNRKESRTVEVRIKSRLMKNLEQGLCFVRCNEMIYGNQSFEGGLVIGKILSIVPFFDYYTEIIKALKMMDCKVDYIFNAKQ